MIDTKKIKELRDATRDGALDIYADIVETLMAGGQEGMQTHWEHLVNCERTVSPMLTKIAAFDEILAMEDHAVSSVSAPSQQPIPFIPPPAPRMTQAELAAHFAEESAQSINILGAGGSVGTVSVDQADAILSRA